MAKKTPIHHQYDSLFKSGMMEINVAKGMIEEQLPPAIAKAIDWNTLRPEKSSYIDAQMSQRFSDMLYRAQSTMGEIVFQVLCEHQSQPDKWMALRLLDYKVQIWRNEMKAGAKQLSIILPIVFYAGKKTSYPYSMDLHDLFAEKKAAEEYALKSAKLVDFTTMSDEELIKERWSAGLKVLLKHMADRDYYRAMKFLIENQIFRFLREQGADRHLGSMLYYTYEHSDEKEALLEQVSQLDPDLEDLVMTIADSLRREGVQQERHVIAENMLREQIGVDLIAKTTGLATSEIQKIQNTLH